MTEGQGFNVKIKVFLHSEVGDTTPKIDNIQIIYDYSGEDATLTEHTVWGWLYDLDGTGSTKTITVQTGKYLFGTRTLITSDPIDVTLQSSGYFEVDIFTETTDPDRLIWYFDDKRIETNFQSGINNFNDLL